MLRLTALLGRRVVDTAGRTLGELDDVAVTLDAAHPAVIGVRIKTRGARDIVGCALARLDAGKLVLVESKGIPAATLMLRRHVLDAQVVDLDGRRIVRVADVFLAEEGEGLALVGVEVGTAPVLRRLGLGFLSRYADSAILDWRQVHLASPAGQVRQLDSPAAAIHHLGKAELAAVAEVLPPARAHQLRRRFGIPHRPRRWREHRGRRFGSVLRARSSAPR